MTSEHRHEEKPWQPTIERESEFNPFVNTMDRAGQLENPPPLEEIEEETSGESGQDERRRAMIAEAAYFIAERRGFSPGSELDDWLAAKVEIDLLFAPAVSQESG